jgi:hypothetical protein
MTMQYDVKSYHASASGNAMTYAVRLKGVTVTIKLLCLQGIWLLPIQRSFKIRHLESYWDVGHGYD